jgi:hypothetical protein
VPSELHRQVAGKPIWARSASACRAAWSCQSTYPSATWTQSPRPAYLASPWSSAPAGRAASHQHGARLEGTLNLTTCPPLWRPAELVTVPLGSAPSSRDRVHDHSVWIGSWAVAIARTVVRRWCGYHRSSRNDRGRRWHGDHGAGRSDDRRRGGSRSSSHNSSSSNGSSNCAPVFAPMHSPAHPRNARCRKRPPDPGLSRVQGESCRRPIE